MLSRIDIPADIRLVVLDLDGTIYRKPRMAFYMILKQWRHMPSLIAERRWRKTQRRALQQHTPQPIMPVSQQWYNASYLPSMVQIIAEHYHPEPWLQPLLDECRTRSIKVIILSDYEAVTDKLRALHLNPAAFDATLATGDFGTIKPDPRLSAVIAPYITDPAAPKTEQAAILWQHVLFIGDRPDTDGALAQSLGAQFILV